MTENSNKIFSDSFLEKFRDDLNSIVGKEMLVVLVASYKKVAFHYLCNEINVKVDKLEAYMQELILD